MEWNRNREGKKETKRKRKELQEIAQRQIEGGSLEKNDEDR